MLLIFSCPNKYPCSILKTDLKWRTTPFGSLVRENTEKVAVNGEWMTSYSERIPVSPSCTCWCLSIAASAPTRPVLFASTDLTSVDNVSARSLLLSVLSRCVAFVSPVEHTFNNYIEPVNAFAGPHDACMLLLLLSSYLLLSKHRGTL